MLQWIISLRTVVIMVVKIPILLWAHHLYIDFALCILDFLDNASVKLVSHLLPVRLTSAVLFCVVFENKDKCVDKNKQQKK